MRFSLILLLACAGDDDKDTNTTTDTGTTNTSDTSDTSDTTTTETDAPQTWNVSFALSGDYEGATLVLVETYFMEGGDDYYYETGDYVEDYYHEDDDYDETGDYYDTGHMTDDSGMGDTGEWYYYEEEEEEEQMFGDTYASALADSDTVTFEFGVPEELYDNDDVEFRMMMPFLLMDDDGDGEHSPGEEVIGISDYAVVYIQGAESELGVQDGWYSWNIKEEFMSEEDYSSYDTGYWEDYEEDMPDFEDVENIPIGPTMGMNPDLQVGGTSELIGDDLRLIVAPFVLFDMGNVSPLVDQELTPSWEIVHTGEPPAEHFWSDEEMGFSFAYELPFVYQDLNGSGAFDQDLPADETVSSVCYMGSSVTFVYYGQATSYEMAMNMSFMEISTGWNIALEDSEDPEEAFLDESQWGDLEINEFCAFGSGDEDMETE